jgi:hypothetical protein
LIDLARWFLGDFSEIDGYAHTYFWDMPVDDNAFLLLKTAPQTGRVPARKLHGMEKYLFIRNLTGAMARSMSPASAAVTAPNGSTSIGCCLSLVRRKRPTWEYPTADDSWAVEFAEFLEDIRLEPYSFGQSGGRLRRVADRRNTFTRCPDMIITRSPLRVSLGGGGTDLPSYYEEHEGFLIAGAIDRYVYVNGDTTDFVEGIFLKYSALEHVSQIDEVKHPIIREALKLIALRDAAGRDHDARRYPVRDGPRLVREFHNGITKSAFTRIVDRFSIPADLAKLACDIEINRLGEPLGKQDQYISAYGGVTMLYLQKRWRG